MSPKQRRSSGAEIVKAVAGDIGGFRCRHMRHPRARGSSGETALPKLEHMSDGPHDDLADRADDAIRAYVLANMPNDPSGELAAKPLRELIHIYGNWQGRHITARPRKVHRSREIRASSAAQAHAAELAERVRKIEAGEDLEPHLSRAVETAFLSTQDKAALKSRQRDQDRDRMLADWGIRHLHLSSFLEPDGFVKRGDDLLFAVFQPDGAYLLGLYRRGLGAGGPCDGHRRELARRWDLSQAPVRRRVHEPADERGAQAKPKTGDQRRILRN